ncbi:MAG: sodium:solute symporter family protein [Desulfurococcaceae archaeon]
MVELNLPLTIIILWLAITYTYSFIISRKKRGVEEWFTAGRRVGLITLWLSLGANIYSSYTFLGLPGETARKGFTVFIYMIYGMIAYIIGYWLIPILWSRAKSRNWLTLADAYAQLYDSRLVEVFVAITASLWIIPYIQLQLEGINAILQVVAGEEALYVTIAIFVLLTIVVTIGGLSATISINALQGAIMLVSIWFLGLTAPIIAYGGYGNLFRKIIETNQTGSFTLIPRNEDLIALYTTITAAPLGFWLWPNRIHNIFAARDIETTRKNTVLTSIFQLSQIPVVIVGFVAAAMYASGTIPKPLSKEGYDRALVEVTKHLYPPALLGLVCAGAVAASISTAVALLQSTAALFSKNVLGGRMKLLWLARVLTLTIASISLISMLYIKEAIVGLLLVGYGGIIQLFPPLVINMAKPGYINKYVATLSMASGMVAVLVFKILNPIKGLYEGFAGILVNILIITLYVIFKKLLHS